MRKGMFTFFGGLVLSALLSFGAMAQQAEIEETINRQFDAFRANDFAAALEFATPNLQRFFQNEYRGAALGSSERGHQS